MQISVHNQNWMKLWPIACKTGGSASFENIRIYISLRLSIQQDDIYISVDWKIEKVHTKSVDTGNESLGYVYISMRRDTDWHMQNNCYNCTLTDHFCVIFLSSSLAFLPHCIVLLSLRITWTYQSAHNSYFSATVRHSIVVFSFFFGYLFCFLSIIYHFPLCIEL